MFSAAHHYPAASKCYFLFLTPLYTKFIALVLISNVVIVLYVLSYYFLNIIQKHDNRVSSVSINII